MKPKLLVVGAIVFLYLLRIRKIMLDDIEIPEFLKPQTCDEPGCIKRAIPKVGKCVECAFEANLPKMYDDLDEILLLKK